jgi:hypothetical protein
LPMRESSPSMRSDVRLRQYASQQKDLSGNATYQVSALIARQMGSHDDLRAAIYPKGAVLLHFKPL